ncbi:polysaccharide pyruvyl transferase family protein [Paracoccus aeridis]|uniref:polysaccharide pyruvyl transferase family protein n=1 Tax=Paracoccus aeridis TaxID=1966466 RepID=UPI00137585DD|nr:polysaccharide pyruvyl transferase family protein [Paracoccus aeridis]
MTTPSRPRRALVTGHLSTVGDVEVLRYVEARLQAMGVPFEVSPYDPDLLGLDPGWVDAATLDPADFTHLIVVCGPYGPNYPVKYPHVLGRFRDCVQVGVNLTMVAPLAGCDPFDALLERDSDRTARPDLSFLHDAGRVPVVGLCLVRRQGEYGDRQLHDQVERRLRALVARVGVAVIELDTTLPRARNRAGIGSGAEFESILARVDALVTTRLHGTVLALKNGVPVLGVDAIQGGTRSPGRRSCLGGTRSMRSTAPPTRGWMQASPAAFSRWRRTGRRRPPSERGTPFRATTTPSPRRWTRRRGPTGGLSRRTGAAG